MLVSFNLTFFFFTRKVVHTPISIHGRLQLGINSFIYAGLCSSG